MSDREYPIPHGEYRGYRITETSGFLTNKLRAKKGNDVHTRRYHPKNQSQERALALLKEDIDNYGVFDK